MAKDKDADKKDKKSKGGGAGGPPEKGEKRSRRAKVEQIADTADDTPLLPAPPPRLYEKYRNELVPQLKTALGINNLLALPRLDKIVISMGVGRFATEGGEGKQKINQAEKELSIIAGQKPVRCKSKKSVANFKVRENMDTGLKVTLRGARMYEFMDRLISLAFPRVKDFRGIDPTGFDKNGNYNFGFTEQTVFPEVDGASVTFQQGMNITICTTAANADHGRELLKQFGMPFRDSAKKD